MAAHDFLTVNTLCPRCNAKNTEVLLYFGVRNQDHYSMGQKYQIGLPIKEAVGSGWVDCASCKMDYFVKVFLRDEKISEVTIDFEKAPYSPDYVEEASIYDSFSQKTRLAQLHCYFGYSIARVKFEDENREVYIRLVRPFSSEEEYQLQFPVYNPIQDYLEMEGNA